MSESLSRQLQRAGVSCRALASWCRCEGGREDRCETCWLDGPENCDRQVVEALVERVVTATEETDQALEMVKYWQGLSSRLCDAVMK